MTSSYPTRRALRLRTYDYSQAGAYFVTLCVEDRRCLFGTITDGTLELNPTGRWIASTWEGLGYRFPAVEMDAFVVMPNHLHGIVVLGEQPVSAESRTDLPEIMRRFKTYTATQFRTRDTTPRDLRRINLWQRGYHDRVIRNDRELNAIREYILNNPMQWHLDRENPDRMVETDGSGRTRRDAGNG